MNAPFPLTGANSATFSRWELSGARTLTLLRQKAPPELRNPGGSPSTSPCQGSGAATTWPMSRATQETPDSPRGHVVGDRLPSSWTLSTAPRSSGLSSCSSHHRKSPPRAGGANDRHLDCWQPRQETHQDSHAPLPKLLLLFPTHGRGPRRAHGRGQHQAERGRRCHQAPWRSLGDPAPTAPTAAGFAHGPAVPRTRSCYTRTVGHIAGCRRRGVCEPCRGRAAE